jgi:hypothetical protein
MSQGNFMFPGRMAYIGRVAEEQRDTGLATRVDQLEPVRRAMEYLQLAADNPREDQRDELLSRAYQEARILQAGVTSIQYAIHEHANMIGTELKLDQPLPTLKPEFKPMATERSRPASGDIRTAPIDSNELTMGGFSSARPPGWGEQASPSTDVPQPDLNVKGIDAGMSGGPPGRTLALIRCSIKSECLRNSIRCPTATPVSTSRRTIRPSLSPMRPMMAPAPVWRRPDRRKALG